MKTIFKILLLIVSFSNAFAKNIYVSKTGNDNNPGTQAAPYLTISKAASVAVAGDIVFIGGGTYEETLKPANSGQNGTPITFQSLPGEKVIITAMQALNGWTSDGNGIWKTTTNWDLGQRNFVMRNTTVLDLARWPNNTDGDRFTLNSERNDGGSAKEVDANAFLTDTDIPNWNWSNGGSILFYGDNTGAGWSTWKALIKGQSQGRVNFDANKNVKWIMKYHPPVFKGDFYLEGIKEALDYKNEWYFNPANKTLFIKLPNNAQPKDGEVQMSRRTTAIDLEGRNHIHIKNLAVFGGSILINGIGNKISNSKVLYGSMTRGIEKGISTGVNAVFVKKNARNTIIEKCEIGYGDGSGVWDSGKNTIIRNNYVHDFNYVGMYDGPVMARGGGSNTKVLNNTITKGGRDALQITNPGSEVAWNDISFSNLIADDCALLYTIGPNLNMDIHHNWFHDAIGRGKLYKAAGIYMDNDAAGVRVYRNVVWNVEWTNIQINWNGKNIDVFNNTLCKADRGTMGAWHKAGTAFSNVKVWNNITDKQTTKTAGGQETETTWEPQSDKQNNIVSKESFVNWANNDFHLKANAPAVDYGRVITGYTNGYKGAKPDAGAYELGDNWVPGIDWNIAQGPNNICYGLPGEGCNGISTPIVESVDFINAPDKLAINNTYTFNVNYAANEPRDIIVEIKSASNVWLGRARVSVAKGIGTTPATISLANPLASGVGYKLSVWLVPTGLDWQAIIVSNNKVFEVEAPFSQLIANGTYTIESTSSNQRLLSRALENHQTKMVNPGNYSDQEWIFNHLGNNIYTIKNRGTNRYLEVPFAKCENATQVATYTDALGNHQKWQVVANGSGIYGLKPAHCLTQGLDRNNGTLNTNVHTYFYGENNGNQKWKIIPVLTTNKQVENTIENKIVLYPNPAKDIMIISGVENAESISVVDLSGRRITIEKQKTENGISLNINNLQPGVYIALITDEEKTTLLKFYKE